MDDMWQREIRQRDLIRDRLRGYRQGVVKLRWLVDDLYGLIQQLLVTDAEWVKRFRSEVDELEILYAVADDAGVLHDLPQRYVDAISHHLANMEQMMKDLVSSN